MEVGYGIPLSMTQGTDAEAESVCASKLVAGRFGQFDLSYSAMAVPFDLVV